MRRSYKKELRVLQYECDTLSSRNKSLERQNKELEAQNESYIAWRMQIHSEAYKKRADDMVVDLLKEMKILISKCHKLECQLRSQLPALPKS